MTKEQSIEKLIDYKNIYYYNEKYDMAAGLRKLELEFITKENWSEKYFLLRLRDVFFKQNENFDWVKRDLIISQLLNN